MQIGKLQNQSDWPTISSAPRTTPHKVFVYHKDLRSSGSSTNSMIGFSGRTKVHSVVSAFQLVTSAQTPRNILNPTCTYLVVYFWQLNQALEKAVLTFAMTSHVSRKSEQRDVIPDFAKNSSTIRCPMLYPLLSQQEIQLVSWASKQIWHVCSSHFVQLFVDFFNIFEILHELSDKSTIRESEQFWLLSKNTKSSFNPLHLKLSTHDWPLSPFWQRLCLPVVCWTLLCCLFCVRYENVRRVQFDSLTQQHHLIRWHNSVIWFADNNTIWFMMQQYDLIWWQQYDLIHRKNSMIWFTDKTVWFDSLTQQCDLIHDTTVWFDSLTTQYDLIHRHNSVIWFTDTTVLFDSLTQQCYLIHWHNSVIWFTDTTAPLDSLTQQCDLIHDTTVWFDLLTTIWFDSPTQNSTTWFADTAVSFDSWHNSVIWFADSNMIWLTDTTVLFDSLTQQCYLIHWHNSVIWFTDTTAPLDSLTQQCYLIRWHNSVIWFADTTVLFDSLTQQCYLIRWHNSVIWFADTTAPLDSLTQQCYLIRWHNSTTWFADTTVLFDSLTQQHHLIRWHNSVIWFADTTAPLDSLTQQCYLIHWHSSIWIRLHNRVGICVSLWLFHFVKPRQTSNCFSFFCRFIHSQHNVDNDTDNLCESVKIWCVCDWCPPSPLKSRNTVASPLR